MTRTERNLHMGSPTKDAPTGTFTYSELMRWLKRAQR